MNELTKTEMNELLKYYTSLQVSFEKWERNRLLKSYKMGGAYNCALCENYSDDTKEGFENICLRCPFMVTYDVSCLTLWGEIKHHSYIFSETRFMHVYKAIEAMMINEMLEEYSNAKFTRK